MRHRSVFLLLSCAFLSLWMTPATLSAQRAAPAVSSSMPVQLFFAASEEDFRVSPVTYRIAKTQAPLRGTIALLLRQKPPAGMRNLLRDLPLKLNRVSLQKGVATIRFSGTYTSRGVGDDERFVNQITSTAMQFPSVKSVRILINDCDMREMAKGCPSAAASGQRGQEKAPWKILHSEKGFSVQYPPDWKQTDIFLSWGMGNTTIFVQSSQEATLKNLLIPETDIGPIVLQDSAVILRFAAETPGYKYAINKLKLRPQKKIIGGKEILYILETASMYDGKFGGGSTEWYIFPLDKLGHHFYLLEANYQSEVPSGELKAVAERMAASFIWK